MKSEGRIPRLFGGWLPGYRCRLLELQNFARRTSNSELRSFSLNRSCNSVSSFDIPCSTFCGSAPRAVSLYPVISVPRPMSPRLPSVFDLRTSDYPATAQYSADHRPGNRVGRGLCNTDRNMRRWQVRLASGWHRPRFLDAICPSGWLPGERRCRRYCSCHM